MISIRESNDNIDKIFKNHLACVKPHVKMVISFYIDIFELFPTIQNTKVADKVVIGKIIAVKRKHDCEQYKRLLKPILKDKPELKNDTHLVKLKYEDNFVIAAKKNKEVIHALKSLILSYEQILSLDFDLDQIATINRYKNWQQEYLAIDFLLKGIFDYEIWFSNLKPTESWGPYQLAIALNIRSCAYCNRHYTFSLTDQDGKKMGRPDFDHFLPKSSNPLLALSFYNLVPSCKECNGPSVKSSKPVSYDTHLNPYEQNSNCRLMRFTYYPNTYEASIGLGDELEIKLQYSGKPSDTRAKLKVEGNIKLFSLDDIYKEHADTVQEIIRKRSMSNDRYIEILQQTYKDFDIGLDEAYRLAFGTYYKEKEFHKRPMSKITKDIAIEMGTLITTQKEE